MVEEYSPFHRLLYYLGGTLLGVLGGFIAIGMMTSPVWSLLAVGGGSEYLSYAILSILGFAVFLSQTMVFAGFKNQQEEAELGWILSTLITIVSVAYYNFILLLTVSVAHAVAGSGWVPIAVVLAIMIPVYEMSSIQRGSLLSIAGLVAFAIASLMITVQRAQDISPENIRLDELPLRFFGGGRHI